MNQEHMKALLLRDKEFLRTLYSSESAPASKKLLNNASDSKLNTLVKFLHMEANGHIKIRKEDFEALSNGHVKFFRKHFESKAALKRLLGERQEKVKVLSKLSPFFPQLLFTLFNQI